ncbi:MAG: hypothetical protein E7258_01525 [Lachnospiraceae bacterium]|nr:hypothetical protein [Lachnospiraceae bacterium]
MSDKMSEVFDAYDMEIYQTTRGRGAILLKTDKGLYQLKSLDVNESRLNAEYIFKEKLCEKGFDTIDRCIKNKDDELVTTDRYGNPYVLRQYFYGKECNITKQEEIGIAVDNLARLHLACKETFSSTESDVHIRANGDFRRRNRELKRIRNFVGKQKSRKEFEDLYIKAFDYFYDKALVCQEKGTPFFTMDMSSHIGYCHGTYNHHSVLINRDEENEINVGTISFDKFYVGNQLTDLYHFMRKAVEKNKYSSQFMEEILDRYHCICPLSQEDVEYIYILYSYPEKFYKISNQYINSTKNWISPKMIEKLTKLMEDEQDKENILKELYKYKSKLKTS